MGRKKFLFDPDSQRFIEYRRPAWVSILYIFVFLLLAASVALFTHKLQGRLHLNPELTILEKKQQRLISEYESLNLKLKDVSGHLSDMQVRDDSIYRSVFRLDPIPSSVREVGLGGSRPYPLLQGFRSSELMINTTRNVDKLELMADVQMKSFNTLLGRALDRKKLLSNKPSILPISPDIYYWISSGFGYRHDPMTGRMTEHLGLDFAAMKGTRVYATGAGKVILTKVSRTGYGREVLIDHGFGYTTRYGHLSNILVHRGQKVHRGTLIGVSGNSGKSTGPHLHYEVRLHNHALNPKLFYTDDVQPQEYKNIIALADSSDN